MLAQTLKCLLTIYKLDKFYVKGRAQQLYANYLLLKIILMCRLYNYVGTSTFFSTIIKPVLLRPNDPYSLSSKELELLNGIQNFVQRLELELSRLDEIIYCNIESKISSFIDLSDEK